jgi:hypothetical protein
MKRQQRLAWGSAGVLLAALMLGACSKPAEPAAQAVRGSEAGTGLNRQASGTGLTGSFPSTSDPSRATRNSTGAMGNSSDTAGQRP